MEQNIEETGGKRFIVSKIAANASGYLYTEKPSRLVPFQGNFPLVKDYQRQRFEEELFSKMWLDECSEWFQEAVWQAQRMEALHEGFKEFLDYVGKLKGFDNLEKWEKDYLLKTYMDKNCITPAYFVCRLSTQK